MVIHNFTPEQSEKILNAVFDFISYDGHAYTFARHLNELVREKVIDEIEAGPAQPEGTVSMNITSAYALEILNNNRVLTDLLFDLEDAIQ